MAANPRALRKQLSVRQIKRQFHKPAPQQRLEPPARQLNRSGQPVVKDGDIGTPPLPKGRQMMPIGSGTPLF